MKLPVAIVNFKAYDTAIGNNAVNLARIIERVGEEYSASVAVAVQPLDVHLVASSVNIPVYSQTVDAVTFGSQTGHILPETLKDIGATGTLLNHSECRLRLADIDFSIQKLNKMGLETCVCTNNPLVSVAAAALKPTMVAVEPPELIGSGISVSSAQPEIITDTVKLVRNINQDVVILCGAGVSTQTDVSTSIKLGSAGVLLASGITKAKDPTEAMAAIVKGLIE